MSVETALSYAALILADAEVDITSDKLSTLLQKADVPADKIWADIYAKALDGKNIKDLLTQISAGSAPAAGAAAGGAAASGGDAAGEEAEESEKEAEESDDDMGFGLFD